MNKQKKILGSIFVIIPIYNCNKFIKNAVNSVLNQEYHNIEIILVDDGSTDGSSDVCDKIAQENKNIHVIHQKNSGVAIARNNGIDYIISHMSENEEICNYICFLDADDAWMPNFFTEHILELLTENYQLIGFQSTYCNYSMSKRTTPLTLEAGSCQGGVSTVWNHGTQSFAAMLYSVSFLKKYHIRFMPIKYSEDKIFSMQCMYLADKIFLENSLLYLYRQNVLSAMSSRPRGISYYVPIIDAYLASDVRMQHWKNSIRGELQEGTILARIYIMDLIDEHYRCWGSTDEIKDLLNKKPEYQQLLNSALGGEQVNNRMLEMKKKSTQYIIKRRIEGVFYKVASMIKRSGVFNKLLEMKRYPISLYK